MKKNEPEKKPETIRERSTAWKAEEEKAKKSGVGILIPRDDTRALPAEEVPILRECLLVVMM